jgi:hypothetical protein
VLREAMDLSLRDLAERSRRLRADAQPGRARGDEPDAAGRGADRRRPRAAPQQLLRLDEDGTVTVVRREERRRGGSDGHRYEILTPPLPGQRAEVSRTRSRPGPAPAARRPARCTSRARRETAVVEYRAP